MTNTFNLVDEPWIPIVGQGKVSLKQLFSSSAYAELGGNPIQKIALMKLLLAIAQSAYTPDDEEECLVLGSDGMANHCLNYLEKWKNSFWLYGEKPFLQMLKIEKAIALEASAVFPDVAMGNTSLVFQTQNKKTLTDVDNALLIVTLMGFALGGKKTDNTISLTPGYEKKPTGKPGTSVGYLGYLHNFIVGSNVLETLWLNLFTHEQIQLQRAWTTGLGIAPWERMPEGEDCSVAKSLKESYLGRLAPLSRFCLFSKEGLHYTEGIHFSGHKEGGIDPSVAVDRSHKEWKAAWVDPEKRPWRMIPSFLSYLGRTHTNSFECLFIKQGIARAKKLPIFGVWSGGLRVSSNAGEQYVSGSDDFVESKIFLSIDCIENDQVFWQIEEEMKFLDELSKITYGATVRYYKQLKADGSKHAGIAVNLFWQLCEKHAQILFQSSTPQTLRQQFKGIAISVYDHSCPKETVRQMTSWANNRPKI